MITTATAKQTALLRGHVRDRATHAQLPCWVEVIGADGSVLGDWKLPGHWPGFPCDGRFEIRCPAGPTRITVRFLLSHLHVCQSLMLHPQTPADVILDAEPWVACRSWNFVAGDSHNHIGPSRSPQQVVRYARALGLGYLNLCQGWMHDRQQPAQPDGPSLARRLTQASVPDCALHLGGEFPKTRYGHVWWVNLTVPEDPLGAYASWHDSAYVQHVEHDASDPGDLQEVCPLKNELPWHTWRHHRRQGAACVTAHPTSWWLHRPDDALPVTNIAAELAFACLSGEPPDAMVVMGYDADQIFYQNLWFHLLNAGYLIAGCAESDGSLAGALRIGRILTYTQLPCGQSYSPQGLTMALRQGRSVMTSGPFIRLTGDGGAVTVGDRLQADGQSHRLSIEAWSAPDPHEALSWVVIYRNGQPWQVRDLRGTATRHLRWEIDVSETDFAWYLVKAYGRNGPTDASCLDVMSYAQRCIEAGTTEYQHWPQVALTNPVFFLPGPWQPPMPAACRLRLQVVNAAGEPIAGCRVRIHDGQALPGDLKADARGQVHTLVPPTAEIEVVHDGQTCRKSIFLDYRPVNACMESLYAGRWRKAYPRAQPGQVPWSAFRLDDLRRALENVDWRWMV